LPAKGAVDRQGTRPRHFEFCQPGSDYRHSDRLWRWLAIAQLGLDDFVDGLERFFWRDSISHLGPLNIGNNHEVSVLQTAEFVSSLVPGSRIEHHPPFPQDPTNRCPDLTLARRVLPGWKANTSYQDGIQRTFEWFRQQIAAAGTGSSPA
jgi:hypothetical protein